jgi:membrane protease subunit HflK
MRMGRHVDTVTGTGLRWNLPAPIETREIVKVSKIEREEFGFRGKETTEASEAELIEASMQTMGNNIVRVSFVVQYRIKDAFAARYRVADPKAILRDAAQAAVRDVVGRMTIDAVLSEGRGEVEIESEEALQTTLDSYGAGIQVDGIQLQEVQPPEKVRAAFDDVVGASQDASRLVNEAEGYRNELLPRSRAEAAELAASAEGYREARIAESTGEAGRFASLAVEYKKAPEVTRRRLYLETMEEVLPDVEKVIIEEGATGVLPYLPLGQNSGRAAQ